MFRKNRKKHWEHVFGTKKPGEVGWYQEKPETSHAFLHSFNLPLAANIIDIGGGDSFFVDNLIELGYQNITVLDISTNAIERAKARLGEKSAQVTWIVSDVTDFQPETQYDFWHDRAAFHFLTQKEDIDTYISLIHGAIAIGGYLLIGTFSDNGPTKCSGLKITQYSEISMCARVGEGFQKLKSITVDHRTPFETTQNYLFCSFRRMEPDSL